MNPWRRLVAMLAETEPGSVQALFRIAIGLCVLGAVGTVVVAGLVEPLWVDRAFGGYRDLGRGPWLVAWLGGPTPRVVWGLVAATLASGTLLTLGIGSRGAALVALQGVMGLTWLNGHAGGSYDELLANALWLLVLSRSDATLSLSCRLRTGAWTDPTARVASWPRWLMVLQLVVVYSSTGFQKVSSYWVPGGDFSALWYILQQPSWQRVDMRWAAPFFPLTQLATALTWCWEISYPLVLATFWARRGPDRANGLRQLLRRLDLRRPYALFGALMHVGTLLLMNVGPFSAITLSFYLTLWHPDELRSVGRRLRSWATARPPAPAPPSPPGRTGRPAA